MKNSFTRFILAGFVALCLVYLPQASTSFSSAAAAAVVPAAPAPDQPFMESALSDLNDAKKVLPEVTPNKGGHREKAIEYVEQAIGEVNAGIDYARQYQGRSSGNSGIVGGGDVEGLGLSGEAVFLKAAFIKDQPHMQDGITSLQSVRGNLQKAAADKGGHRTAALRLIQSAVGEVKAGIRFAS